WKPCQLYSRSFCRRQRMGGQRKRAAAAALSPRIAEILLAGRNLGAFRAAGTLGLGDARLLAAESTQIIELGAANFAAANHLDRVDHGRVEREHALDALSVRNLAHREVLVDAAARTADADAFVSLHTRLVAFDDLDVDQHRVARLEVGNVLARRELLDLLLIELLNDIHCEFSVGSASNRRAVFVWSEWVGELVLQSFRLVTLWIRAVFRRFADLVCRPEVGAAFRREALRLRLAPRLDLGVVPGGEHLGDRLALKNRWPGVLRVFEQPVSETFLGGGGFLPHDGGEQAHAGIQQCKCRDFAAVQNEIAKRYFLEAAHLDQALVDTFKACAHNDNSQSARKLCGPALPEGQPAWTHQQTRTRVMR